MYPGVNSGTDGSAPYPSGSVGTPGPIDGYCGPGNATAETQPTSAPVRQPNGTTLPLAPAYFPHIVRNADGTLTGYFDYRPKDTDEAIMVATSSDNGRDWTYQGEALEQNPGYCPSADTNDDGQGHPNVITVGGVTRLYTLQRPAGDNIGVGMLVHTLSAPSSSDPLTGVPATEQVGIDPDVFATAPATVNATASTISTSAGGPVNSPEQLVPGRFVDLTQTPVPTQSSVITCTGVGATSLTGCTAATGTIAVANGDLIEQVIGTASAAVTVPAGPNKTTGDSGLSSLTINFADAITAYTLNANAPNRLYLDGVAVYCNQSNANPTTKIEDCTTGPAGSPLAVAVGDPLTSDPVVPAAAQVTTGLVAPDGIVGVLPSYPGAPADSTVVMYTEKLLSYYEAGVTTNSAAATFGSSFTFVPTASESADMPATISPADPVTVSMGDTTKGAIIPVTCTGLTLGTGTIENNTSPTNDTLTGCTVPSVDTGDSYNKTSMIGAPGAATVPGATLALTGEGSTSSSNLAKLAKNNEDLTVLRVAYTTDGITFSSAGLDNNGIISGSSNGASNYQDINNPATTASPSNLNAYAAPGTTDATEMRWVGSAGSIITNPDGSYGLFLSGAWAADGDSDAFNQIFYSSSTDGEHWTEPVRWCRPTTPSRPRWPRTPPWPRAPTRPSASGLLLGPGLRAERGPESRRHPDPGLRRLPVAQADQHGGHRGRHQPSGPVHGGGHRPGPLSQHPGRDPVLGHLPAGGHLDGGHRHPGRPGSRPAGDLYGHGQRALAGHRPADRHRRLQRRGGPHVLGGDPQRLGPGHGQLHHHLHPGRDGQRHRDILRRLELRHLNRLGGGHRGHGRHHHLGVGHAGHRDRRHADHRDGHCGPQPPGCGDAHRDGELL